MTIIEPLEVGGVAVPGQVLTADSSEDTGEAPAIDEVIGKMSEGQSRPDFARRVLFIRRGGAEADFASSNQQSQLQARLPAR